MIFAETSALAWRILGSKGRRASASAALSGDAVCTSTYVLNEFRCTFLADALTLYYALLDSETVEEALGRLTEDYTENRKQSRSWDVYRLLLRQDAFIGDRERAIELIENLLSGGLELKLLRDVENAEILDGTGCKRADEVMRQPTGELDFGYRCQKGDPPKCDVAAFLASMRSDLLTLAANPQVAEVHGKKRDQVAQCLVQAIDNPADCRGRTCSSHLSDIIIALEAPPGSEICTANVKHFAPLCDTLAKPLRDANPPKLAKVAKKSNR